MRFLTELKFNEPRGRVAWGTAISLISLFSAISVRISAHFSPNSKFYRY